MDQNQAKEKIKALVEKYNVLSESERNKYNEEETKNYFIRPLFEALCWDFTDSNEVAMERGSVGKRADYEFKLNGIPKVYLEAKSIRTDLNLEQHARQAINYAWNKGVTWAVLTDFESIKVFNAQGQSKLLADKLVFEISVAEYLTDDRLWLLSKESFLESGLDKYAEKYAKKIKKQTVNESLFEDLRVARELLTESFGMWNKEVDKETLDEGVQKILDRLVFVRVLEDRGLEPSILKQMIHEREAKGTNVQLFDLLIKKFRELDEYYNSNLFSPHACEKWVEYDNKLKKVILMLYGGGTYEYDFKQIPADVLGGVYESYLSYIAQKPIEVDKEGKSGKLLKIEDKKEMKEKSRKKRKEQGIYYTPKFIVDYIVKNTLGEKLKEVKTVNELKKIKVLDPSCGSGSFLTRALEEMFEKYRDFNYRGGKQEVKTTILLENIYGVDLDVQAVELACLNLLIDALDTRAKLPKLAKNIKNGNSLISGTEKELKKYFGENWREKKPFDWQDEFSDVFKQGGFDVIIGNPPYVSFYSKQAQTSSETEKELTYFRRTYSFIEDKEKLGRFNTVMFFVEKTLHLLNNGGLCGFIVDMNIFGNPYKDLRKYILENSKILSIVTNLTGFEGVGSGQVIVIFQKNTRINENNQNEIFWSEDINCKSGIKIKQGDWYNPKNDFQFRKSEDRKIISLMKKINKRGFLGDAYPEKLVRTSITFTGKKNEFLILPTELEKYNNKQVYPLLEGSNSVNDRYCVATFKNYVNYDEKLRDKLNNEYVEQAKKEKKRTPMVIGLGSLDAFKSPKIFVRLSSKKITATYSKDVLCADLSLYVIVNKSRKEESHYSLKYTLAILNSKLVDFYAKENKLLKQEKGGMPQIRLKDLKRLPLYMIDFSNKSEKEKYTEIEKLADKMLDLNKQFHPTPENSEKYNYLKSEIEKTDKKIDGEVYKLYGLTEEEIEIVESLPCRQAAETKNSCV